MHTGEWPLREEWIEGGDAARESLRKVGANLRANFAVVALARHVDEHRDETIKAVAPRQHAHARVLLELQNRDREVIEQVLVDLEQLVARVLIDDIGERLAGVDRKSVV